MGSSRLANAAIVVAILTVSMPLASAGAEPTHIGALDMGEAIFWSGPFIESAGVRSPLEPVVCHGPTGSLACVYTSVPPTVPACVPGLCIEYTIDVLATDGTLRVALDHPTSDDSLSLMLLDPSGTPTGAWAWNIGTYSVEARALNPSIGRWTIQVLLHSVERSDFRMRATLESAPAAPGTPVALLPNLQVRPPFDLTFDGCQLRESVENAPERCLRFSSGPNNVGDGPLDIRIREVGLSGPAIQRVYWSDGSFVERPGGTFVYHTQHAHYHHVATGGYRLYRVTDATTGAMVKVGDGPKIGFCMADGILGDWQSFAQEPQGARTGECNGRVVGPPGPQVTDLPMFGLSTGWGDVYAYYIDGNYIDIGSDPDGVYVLAAAADPDDAILETDESDNDGYTYFSVTAGAISVLERGRGLSPWDPAKQVVDDGRRGVRL